MSHQRNLPLSLSLLTFPSGAQLSSAGQLWVSLAPHCSGLTGLFDRSQVKAGETPPAAGQLPPPVRLGARSVEFRKATGEGGIAERSNTLYQTTASRYLFRFSLKVK